MSIDQHQEFGNNEKLRRSEDDEREAYALAVIREAAFEEGRREAKLEAAKIMFGYNRPFEEISTVTGISIDRLKRMKAAAERRQYMDDIEKNRKYLLSQKESSYRAGHREGYAIGLALAKEEDLPEFKMKIALRLIHDGLSLQEISIATGLSPAELKKIQSTECEPVDQ